MGEFTTWEEAARRELEIESAEEPTEADIADIERSARLRNFIQEDVWRKDIEPLLAEIFRESFNGMMLSKLGEPELMKHQALNGFCIRFRNYIEGGIKRGDALKNHYYGRKEG